jgi:hypothetical protein
VGMKERERDKEQEEFAVSCWNIFANDEVREEKTREWLKAF